jgi:hypothetical protein
MKTLNDTKKKKKKKKKIEEKALHIFRAAKNGILDSNYNMLS